jgi:hypothetical protein
MFIYNSTETYKHLKRISPKRNDWSTEIINTTNIIISIIFIIIINNNSNNNNNNDNNNNDNNSVIIYHHWNELTETNINFPTINWVLHNINIYIKRTQVFQYIYFAYFLCIFIKNLIQAQHLF